MLTHRLIVSLVTLGFLGGCQLAQKQWISDVQGVPLGAPQQDVLRQVGKPDAVMSMQEFVSCLDADPAVYTTSLGRVFHSYRDYALYMMMSILAIHQEDTYDPGWWAAPPYSKCEVWLYDESRRYSKPYFIGSWSCTIYALEEGMVVRKFVLGFGSWDVTKFRGYTRHRVSVDTQAR